MTAYYDELFMRHALSLAKKGWGKTGINPLVGALVIKKNRIISRGYHRKIGDAHAEVCALLEAGNQAKNATLYVNLEPCCTTGLTPPCVNAIRMAGIKRVVISTTDPNPEVRGKGVECLKQNNVEVTLGVLADEAKDLNKWYAQFITGEKPYIILKIATSHDQRISGFKEKYITSEASRRFVHSLRSRVDAVVVGINTVLADDCCLTDRLIGRHNPARVVIDPHLRIPLDSHFMTRDSRRIVITNSNNDVGKIELLIAQGVELIIIEGNQYAVDKIIAKLRMLRISSLMIEGGARVFSDFFNSKQYDEIYLFVAPHEVGNGIALNENIWERAVSSGSKPIKIGEDQLYHVYRDN